MLKNKYRLHIIIVLTILLLGLQACGNSEPFPDLDEPIKIKVSLRNNLSYAPLIIAKEEGFFAELGLDVEFVAAPPPLRNHTRL